MPTPEDVASTILIGRHCCAMASKYQLEKGLHTSYDVEDVAPPTMIAALRGTPPPRPTVQPVSRRCASQRRSSTTFSTAKGGVTDTTAHSAQHIRHTTYRPACMGRALQRSTALQLYSIYTLQHSAPPLSVLVTHTYTLIYRSTLSLKPQAPGRRQRPRGGRRSRLPGQDPRSAAPRASSQFRGNPRAESVGLLPKRPACLRCRGLQPATR